MIGKQDGGTWDAVEQGIGEMINELFVRVSGKRGRGGGIGWTDSRWENQGKGGWH